MRAKQCEADQSVSAFVVEYGQRAIERPFRRRQLEENVSVLLIGPLLEALLEGRCAFSEALPITSQKAIACYKLSAADCRLPHFSRSLPCSIFAVDRSSVKGVKEKQASFSQPFKSFW